ncbi:MAG: M23 family metallopeptidase [Thermoleophilia bacterium]
MFDRIRVWGSLCYLGVFWLGIAVSAGAVCGESPSLPPDGLVWPVAGDITETWSLDCRSDRGHRGVDIAADAGTEIRAAAAGTVGFVGYTPAENGGITITIDHDGGLRTTYLHVSAPRVSRGEYIIQGQIIATTTGLPVHFGIKQVSGSHEAYFNPLELLSPLTSDAGPATATPAPAPLPQPEPTMPPAATVPLTESPLQSMPVELPAAPAPAPVSPSVSDQPVLPFVVQSLPVILRPPISGAAPYLQTDPGSPFINPDSAALINMSAIAQSPLNATAPYFRTANVVRGTYFSHIKTGLMKSTASSKHQTRVTEAAKPVRGLAVAAAVLLLSVVATLGGRLAGSVEDTPSFGLGKYS